jgi:sec-independent protein translocase protein TatA
MVLFLNDVAGSEILLILFLVLIFFGSKSIPGLARTLGRTIRQVKAASADIQSEIKKSSNEMKRDLNLKGIIEETAQDIKRPLDQHARDIDNAVNYQAPKRSHLETPTPMPKSNPASEIKREEDGSKEINDDGKGPEQD